MSDVVEWTPHESALWWTCIYLRDLTRLDRRPQPVPVHFAMQQDPTEYVYQWGAYERSWFGAAGDGSYRNSWLVAGGFSPLGLGVGALTLGASAALNSGRKARAKQAATATWRPIDTGAIYISTHGYYLANSSGLLSFGYNGHISAGIVRPRQLQFEVTMSDGQQQRFVLWSDWAELIFVNWALRHCPDHPQMRNMAWLPEDFLARIRDSGVSQQASLQELM
jgi:hypothetical protein